jgi:hypothetical protein
MRSKGMAQATQGAMTRETQGAEITASQAIIRRQTADLARRRRKARAKIEAGESILSVAAKLRLNPTALLRVARRENWATPPVEYAVEEAA